MKVRRTKRKTSLKGHQGGKRQPVRNSDEIDGDLDRKLYHLRDNNTVFYITHE